MKQLFFSIFFGISAIALNAQNMDCSIHKNGKFQITGPGESTVHIERNGNTQIEYDSELKVKIEFTVTWIDDCTYTLKIKEVLENPNKLELPMDMVLRVEMKNIQKDSYDQVSTSDMFEGAVSSTVVRKE